MMPTTTESLRQDLTKLKLGVMAANLDSVLEETAKRNRDAAYAFKLLLAMETEARWKTSIARRFADSKLVEQLSIDQFDWNHHHSRRDQKGVITSLLNPDFIDQHRRKTGNESMCRTLQTMLADTPLVKNLHNSKCMAILLDGKSSIEELFAALAAMSAVNPTDFHADTGRMLPGFRALITQQTLPEKIIYAVKSKPRLAKSN